MGVSWGQLLGGGKSIGNQAGDRTACPQGHPAAWPLQGPKQFEAIAEWADLLVLRAWQLHWLSLSAPKPGPCWLLRIFQSKDISKPPQEITPIN